MQTLQILNPENATEEEYSQYPTREAARAIVFDKAENIALLFVARENFYKLPGGGKEGNESFKEALRRECLEEIGCEIDIQHEVGRIVEYRKFYTLKQVSECFMATVRGSKGEPQLTEEEIADGFEVVWLSLPEALKRISKNEATSLEGKEYIVPRDMRFLRAMAHQLRTTQETLIKA